MNLMRTLLLHVRTCSPTDALVRNTLLVNSSDKCFEVFLDVKLDTTSISLFSLLNLCLLSVYLTISNLDLQ